VTNQIPDPRRHLTRFYGAYANRLRERYREEDGKATAPVTTREQLAELLE